MEKVPTLAPEHLPTCALQINNSYFPFESRETRPVVCGMCHAHARACLPPQRERGLRQRFHGELCHFPLALPLPLSVPQGACLASRSTWGRHSGRCALRFCLCPALAGSQERFRTLTMLPLHFVCLLITQNLTRALCGTHESIAIKPHQESMGQGLRANSSSS